jgi:hypothetical protein
MCPSVLLCIMREEARNIQTANAYYHIHGVSKWMGQIQFTLFN